MHDDLKHAWTNWKGAGWLIAAIAVLGVATVLALAKFTNLFTTNNEEDNANRVEHDPTAEVPVDP